MFMRVLLWLSAAAFGGFSALIGIKRLIMVVIGEGGGGGAVPLALVFIAGGIFLFRWGQKKLTQPPPARRATALPAGDLATSEQADEAENGAADPEDKSPRSAFAEGSVFAAINLWLIRNTWFGPTFLLSLIIVPIGLGIAFSERKPSERVFNHVDALTMCQIAIKRAARDQETAKVPYVENQGESPYFFYIWNDRTKPARMRNGLGLEVPVSASCVVDGTSKKITSLIVGEDVLI